MFRHDTEIIITIVQHSLVCIVVGRDGCLGMNKVCIYLSSDGYYLLAKLLKS